MVWQIPFPPRKRQIVSGIQGLPISVNDQESELDDWIDQIPQNLKYILFWFFQAWIHFSVRHLDSFIPPSTLEFGAHTFEKLSSWRSDLVTPLGWRCLTLNVASRTTASTASWFGFHVHPWCVLKLEINQKSISDPPFLLLKPMFFFSNQRWAMNKNGNTAVALGCIPGGQTLVVSGVS